MVDMSLNFGAEYVGKKFLKKNPVSPLAFYKLFVAILDQPRIFFHEKKS